MENVIFLFLMICVFVIKPLYSLKDFNYNKMLEGHTFRTLRGISLDECWTNCEQRPACGSINYRRKSHLCQLNSAEQFVGLTTQVGVVFREKRDPAALETVDCGPNTCNKAEVCDIESMECKIKECIPPKETDNVNIKGNMASVGSKKLYSCKEGFMPSTGNRFSTAAVCERDGWTHDIECIPLTCKRLAENGETSSDMYKSYDEGSQMIIDIFCDFNINTSIGYTFLSSLTLDPRINISMHYTLADHVMLRHVRIGDSEQYESKMEMLPQYRGLYNVSLFNSEHPDFSSPQMSDVTKPYLYIGFLPNSFGSHENQMKGYSCNGNDFSFNNCDVNKNNYLAIFVSQYHVNVVCYNTSIIKDGWKLCSQPIAPSSYMPVEAFFDSYEIGMGGCGCFERNCDTNVNGFAFGLPFDF